MPHVYFDDQTRRLLEQHKSENQNFNLSQFVQKMIKEYSYENENIDIAKVTHEIENVDLEIKRLEEKKRYLSEKKTHAIKSQKEQSKNDIEHIASFKESFLQYCDVSEPQAQELAEEYLTVKHMMSITKFINEKGVKLR